MARDTASDSEVISRLVANHRAFLEFLTRRVGDRSLAEEILQDAFVRGVSRVEQLQDTESALAWFYRTLRNAVTDHHRRKTSRSVALEKYASEFEVGDAVTLADAKEIACRCVSELAGNLAPAFADALQRIEIEGMPVSEYASVVGITANNAAVRVFRARRALRREVERACGTCAEHGCLDCSCGAGQTP
jgi:RNA polymerase sigma-70 factor (ECF subfamily)